MAVRVEIHLLILLLVISDFLNPFLFDFASVPCVLVRGQGPLIKLTLSDLSAWVIFDFRIKAHASSGLASFPHPAAVTHSDINNTFQDLLRLDVGVIVGAAQQVQLSFWITLWLFVVKFELSLICVIVHPLIFAFVYNWDVAFYLGGLMILILVQDFVLTFISYLEVFDAHVLVLGVVLNWQYLVEVYLGTFFSMNAFFEKVIYLFLVNLRILFLIQINRYRLTIIAFNDDRLFFKDFLVFLKFIHWFQRWNH